MALSAAIQAFTATVLGTPRVSRATPVDLIGTDASGVLLTATNQAGAVLDVTNAREVTITLDADFAAAASKVTLYPMFSAAASEPLVTDDSWFNATEIDTAAAALPGGTQLASVDFTLTPEFAARAIRPLVLQTEASDGATDEGRLAVTLKCAPWRWFTVLATDVSGAGTLATIKVKAIRSI